MALDTGTAILILGAFVLPGFITLILRERLYVVRGEVAPFDRLLSALLYSAVIYGFLLVVAHRAGLQKSDLVEFHDGEKPLGDDLLAAAAILLLLPASVAIAGSRWIASKSVRPWALRLAGSSETHSATSAWNVLFDEQGPCLVRATLIDGRIIGGLYDDRSVAGYTEQIADLHLSQRWDLDANRWFLGPTAQSVGLWLSSESIVSLEFYDLEGVGDLDGEIPKIRS